MASSQLGSSDPSEFRIWADNRQALCDALPYFKSHESSLYTSRKIAKGFLISQHVTVRDMLGSEVIITTLGGGRKMDDNGKYTRTAMGSKLLFTAATRAMEDLAPIGVILGDKYPLVSVPLKHVYNVLDFFTITDIWSEKDTTTANGVSVWKIRLEKTTRISESWWHSGDDVQPEGGFPEGTRQCIKCQTPSKQIFSQDWTCLNAECEDSFTFAEGVNPQELSFACDQASTLAWCLECHKSSKTVFKNGWTCLNKDCDAAYFKFPTGVDINNLSYSKEFLEERTAHVLPETYTLQPRLPAIQPNGFMRTVKHMRVGIVCPSCGCCSRRKVWVRWFYENAACDFVYDARPRPFPLARVRRETALYNAKRVLTTPKVDSKILQNTSAAGGYAVEQYLLPDPLDPGVIIGSVTIFRASDTINRQLGGPNEMWNQLQTNTISNDFGLQRNAAVHPGLPSEKLTRHFLQNFGAPYKFAVDVTTRAFTGAPPAIIAALKRMRWAGRMSVEKTNSANRNVGRRVLHFDSISDTFVDFNELLFLGYMEDDRIGFHDDGEDTLGPTVATLSLGSPAQMMFRYKKKYLGKDGGRGVVLKFPLRHGDMVVMHGTRIHQAYEHAVDPKGERRFALTSRNIVLDSLDDKTRAEAIRKCQLPSIPAFWNFPIANNEAPANIQTAPHTQQASNVQPVSNAQPAANVQTAPQYQPAANVTTAASIQTAPSSQVATNTQSIQPAARNQSATIPQKASIGKKRRNGQVDGTKANKKSKTKA